MALTDLTATELPNYRSAQAEPDDFDDFWQRTLAETRSHDLGVTLTKVDSPVTTVDLYDVTFNGYGGDPIRAWLRMPAGATGPLPAVVEFMGYGGGRGLAEDRLMLSSSGFVHLAMDTRGQGSSWSVGDTPDPHGTVSHHPGFMTVGIDSPENYYYRRVFMDAVRAVEAARSLDFVDAARVGVIGGSQGGGISLAVTALLGDLAATQLFVPFLCDFSHVIMITDADPYNEIVRYLNIHRDKSAAVHHTLSYFDGVNFAKRAGTPARFTAALMDRICPPSSVYGAYANYVGEKAMTLWEYNGHEGGGIDDEVSAARWFGEMLAK